MLLYLADCERRANVTSIASVSGGSLANAGVGYRVDYALGDDEDVEAALGATARAATVGTLFRWWGTWAFLVAGFALAAGGIAAVLAASLSTAATIGASAAIVLLYLCVLGLRGRVCALAFAHTVFGGRRPLSDLEPSIDHVICATDLHRGEHVYFARDFVASYGFGLGTPNGLGLHRAVQASAAFPPAFPVSWFRTAPLGFQQPASDEASRTRRLATTDGGVYDNMADQWIQGLETRVERWQTLEPQFRDADQLVVANASAGLGWKPTRSLQLPIIGEFGALLRDKSVLYDNGTSLRRKQLIAGFELARSRGRGRQGSLVHISQSPFKGADTVLADENADPARKRRAEAVLSVLAGPQSSARDEWVTIAEANASVKTVLNGLGEDVAVRLLRHAYVLAMCNLHIFLDFPLSEVPESARFERLVSGP